MATYQEIKGGKLKNYTEDPDNPYVGQLWYNTTVHGFRIRKSTLSNSWSSGGNLNTARWGLGAAGTQTAALGFGGNVPPNSALTEAYDGSSWTELNDMNTARELAGTGTQTAGLAFGGANPDAVNNTEQYDGTSWTEVNNLNTARAFGGRAGATNTAALCIGGTNVNNELWNGTNWTELGDLNTARNELAGNGVAASALAYGGLPTTAATEEWNAAPILTKVLTD